MSLELNTLHHGDCLAILKTLPDESVDSICTDPPYGLGNEHPTPEELIAYLQGAELKTGDFMNKPWDIPPVSVWKECFRVLKPGGHLLAFAGTRTFDLMSMGIRMAGFENRDTIATQFGPQSVMQWVQSQGFPKSHSIDKAIDKKKGAKRKVVGTKRGVGGENLNDIVNGKEVRQTTDEGGKGVGAYGVGAKQVGIDIPVTEPATEEAKKWEGWGTALKPSWEPILVFRKPIAEKSVVAQVLATGTGAINIDGCRVRTNDALGGGRLGGPTDMTNTCGGPEWDRPWMHDEGRKDDYKQDMAAKVAKAEALGRWPANFILVHSDGCKVVGTKRVKAPVINRFDDGMKPFGEGAGHEYTSTQTGDENGEEQVPVYECAPGCPSKELDDQSGLLTSHGGGSSRSFEGAVYFIARGDSGGASRFFAQFEPDAPFTYCAKAPSSEKVDVEGAEQHPTVKPLKLMRYLVRLVTPPGGVVLDPYVGSGTTAVAAILEGVNFVAIEKHEGYIARAQYRIIEASSPEKRAESAPPPAPVEVPKPIDQNETSILDLALSDD